MTINAVTKALSKYGIEVRVPILLVLSKGRLAMCEDYSQNIVAEIGMELSQVSGGSGIDLISLLMTRDDNSQFAQKTIRDVQYRLDQYISGTKYELYVKTPADLE